MTGGAGGRARFGRVRVHWFETWAFGAVGDDDVLGLHLLAALAAEVEATAKEDPAIERSTGRPRRAVALVGRALAVGAVNRRAVDHYGFPALEEAGQRALDACRSLGLRCELKGQR